MHEQLWHLPFWGRPYALSPYLLFNGLALIIGLQLLDNQLRHEIPEKERTVYLLFVLSVAIGWLSAHVLDCLVRNREIFNGGFTFYGGMLGGTVFFIASSLLAVSWENTCRAMNCAVIPMVFSHAIGRLGCFFGGCCYGTVLDPSHPLACFFERHPTQLYEALFLLALGLFLTAYKKKHFDKLALAYLILYPAFRFFNEYLRDDDRGSWYGLSSSQWISLALFLSGLVLVGSQRSWRKDSASSGAFLKA